MLQIIAQGLDAEISQRWIRRFFARSQVMGEAKATCVAESKLAPVMDRDPEVCMGLWFPGGLLVG